MRQPITANIDGETYLFGYLITSDAINVAVEVGRRFAPLLGTLVGQLFKDKKDVKIEDILDLDLSSLDLDFALLAVTAASAMDPVGLEALIRKLCSVVSVSGSVNGNVLVDSTYQNHFMGRPGVALQVAVKSFEVNCKDFFFSAVKATLNLKPKSALTQAN